MLAETKAVTILITSTLFKVWTSTAAIPYQRAGSDAGGNESCDAAENRQVKKV
jgi:hypothetical protein